MENWLPVVGYEGYYEVSDQGQVKTVWVGKYRKQTGRILKYFFQRAGYKRVHLTRDGRQSNHLVHRLVATAFIAPATAPYLNHKDGNKVNNYLDNLEWVTAKENTDHAITLGLMVIARGEENRNAVLTEDLVMEMRRVYIPYHKEFGGSALSRRYGVCQQTVSAIVSGKAWTHVT